MSDSRWKRPESVPLPTVWRRFQGRKPVTDGGDIPEFWIQDVTEDLLEEVIDHMVAFFLRDEPISKATRLLQDERSLLEIKNTWRKLVRTYKVSLVALTQENGAAKPKVVGANIFTINYKGESSDNSKYGPALRKLLDALDIMSNKVDLFQMYSTDEYISGVGLSVAPQFRGQGIGEQLLLARRDIGPAVGLKTTATVFTAVQSQTLAERVGFETVLVMPYNEFLIDGKVALKNIEQESGVTCMKLMAWRLI